MTTLFPRRISSLILTLAIALPLYSAVARAQTCASLFELRSSESSLRLNLMKRASKDPENPWGPRVFMNAQPGAISSYQTMKKFVLAIFNVRDLAEKRAGQFPNNHESDALVVDSISSVPELSKRQIEMDGIGEAHRRADPDASILIEADSIGALEALDRGQFKDTHKSGLINGNDPNDRDIGIMAKLDIPFDIEIQSFKNIARPGKGEPLFTRDMVVYAFRPPGADPKSRPAFIIIGNHLKSLRPPDLSPVEKKLPREEQAKILAKKGDRTDEIRDEQIDAMKQVMEYYMDVYGDSIPIMAVGDLNRDIKTGTEFAPLRNAGMREAFDIAATTMPINQRNTHATVMDGKIVPQQLDGAFCSPGVWKNNLLTSALIVPYRDKSGNLLLMPVTWAQLKARPSDHNLVVYELDMELIRTLREAAVSGN